MGWTFPHGATRRQVIDELTPAERKYGESMGNGVFRTLRHCCRGNVLYALHETVKGDGASNKWIGVYLLQRDNRDGTWGYKDMDETMHPYYYGCPVSYLDAADEPMNESAAGWRAEVRRQAAERKAQNAKRPKVGEVWSYRGRNCREVEITYVHVRRIEGRNLTDGDTRGCRYSLSKKSLGDRLLTAEEYAVKQEAERQSATTGYTEGASGSFADPS